MTGGEAAMTESEKVSPTAESQPPAKPSGLRNPTAAVRGVGAGALVVEALVLLLALVPMHVLGVRSAGAAMITIGVIAFVCVVLAGALRSPWAWWGGLLPQAALIGCAYFTVSLAALGVLFGLLWFYVLSVRRSVLGK
jgi:hypothetical protein